jgi:predicted glycoside hydrolase/deacetylase ChbG (UPF0249 family)
LRFFLKRSLRGQLAAEIRAQFSRFRGTGLKLDHVNGHLHIHLHPIVFRLLVQSSEEFGMDRMRLTRDPFWLNARLARGRWMLRMTYAVLFNLLAARVRPVLRRLGIRHTKVVFGVLQDARVDERYVERLIAELPPGDSELYSHPSLDEFRHELDALISPRVRRLLENRGVELIRYQDL